MRDPQPLEPFASPAEAVGAREPRQPERRVAEHVQVRKQG